LSVIKRTILESNALLLPGKPLDAKEEVHCTPAFAVLDEIYFTSRFARVSTSGARSVLEIWDFLGRNDLPKGF
jgi:hypothetical protein